MSKKSHVQLAENQFASAAFAPEFRLRGLAKIQHLNLRKDAETEILSVDIKLCFERCDRKILNYFDPDLIPFFWLNSNTAIGTVDLAGDLVGSTMMAVKNIALQPVGYSHEIENVDVNIGSVDLNSSKVKKFAILPLDGGVIDFTCSISSRVSEDEVANLSQYLSSDVQVLIAEQPKLI